MNCKNLTKEEFQEKLKDIHSMACHTIIHTASISATGIAAGLAQLPFADAAPLAGIQGTMIIAIGYCFKVSLVDSTVKSLLGTFTTTLVGRNVAGTLVGMIPGYGNAIKGVTAGSLTEAIGWKAVDYFSAEYAEVLYREQENADRIGKEYEKKYCDLADKFDALYKEQKITVLDFLHTRRAAKDCFSSKQSLMNDDYIKEWENEYNEIEAMFIKEIEKDIFSDESNSFKKNEELYERISKYGEA